LVLALAAVVMTVLSCQSVSLANQSPTANAGPDQTVQFGATVTLNGSGSSDPDAGDTISFAWTQTAGTAVVLTGATTAAPSFTAPSAATTLTFQLTVADSQAQTDTDTVDVTCQAAPPTNQAPTANAGPDQNVQFGAAVNLDGSGSSDPDAGDTLTFAWTQTAGTAVTLTGDTTATPSFTAPNAATTLTFQLTVTDTHAATDTDTVDIICEAPPVTPRLYIANLAGNNITSYANPATVNGNIAPDTNLAGAATLLANPSDIVVNSAGALLASNFSTPSVTGYADAENTNGNQAPNRNVQGGATGLGGPTTLAINTAQDLVFVANIATAPDSIVVYADTASASFNGNLAPTRTIQSGDLNNPFGINFGGGDDLYVANNANNNVLVFANASSRNGVIAATRILTNAAFAGIFDVYVDSSDRLYVVNSTPNRVDIFNNASSLNGSVSPAVSLTVTGATSITAIAVDAAGTGYIVDSGANAVYAYNNIATRNGTLAPDRTIQGGSTQLSNPIRVFLVE